MKQKTIAIIFFTWLVGLSYLTAQIKDTVEISSANINTSLLREGTNRYLVYFKMKNDSLRTQTQFWTRKIKKINYKGKDALEIDQKWEDKDSIFHIVKSISDAKTMRPLYHQTWWKVQMSKDPIKVVNVTTVDFLNKSIDYNGKLLNDTTTDKRAKLIWDGFQSSKNNFFLNWHLDLESFPLLPYAKGVTFLIPFYDPGTASNFEKVYYTVTGSAELTGFNDQKIECWLLVHESDGNKEVYWISKKTNEVLKLEQKFGENMYRYKIKLSFSI